MLLLIIAISVFALLFAISACVAGAREDAVRDKLLKEINEPDKYDVWRQK